MKLKKVKLVANGFGGCQITYLKQEEKKGRLFNVEVTEKKKNPIHLALEKKFKELRPFMLSLCKVLRGDEDKAMKDFLISETEMSVLQIVIDTTSEGQEGSGFILEGSSTILSGNKEVKLKTPKIESEDGYDDFDAVQLIIKELVAEVMVYLSGNCMVSDEEALIRWYERKKDVDEDQIERIKQMSQEDQKSELTKILEAMGSVVINVSDIAQNDEEISENGADEFKEETFTIEPEKEVIMLKK